MDITIDKAIQVLARIYVPSSDPALQEFGAALRIGIEALARVKADRLRSGDAHHRLLPGETEE